MPKIAAKPVMFKGQTSVGTDEYTAHLSQSEFQPTQPTASFTDIEGTVSNFGGKSGWALVLAGAQDWETVNSLSQYLLTHDAEEVEVTVTLPGGGTATGTVIAAATNIGGTANTPMTFSTTMQVLGTPTFTPGV
ncbi:hypothetical protein [Microbacterium sp.]|uniref:hypothetical protein n=1 Tax=Microbacterium sp. TaxID=51671 RepID=UPI003A9416B0